MQLFPFKHSLSISDSTNPISISAEQAHSDIEYITNTTEKMKVCRIYKNGPMTDRVCNSNMKIKRKRKHSICAYNQYPILPLLRRLKFNMHRLCYNLVRNNSSFYGIILSI